PDVMVIAKGLTFYPGRIEMIVLGQPGLGPEYQIALDSEAGGERMTIFAEAGVGGDAAVARRVRQAVHDLLGISPEVRLCAPGELPRQEGKATRVADRRTSR